MNIVVTGSLGNVSNPLARMLVQKGHEVTVISRSSERQADIDAIGAKAAIGTMQDVSFLTNTFRGADVVYLMETLDRHTFTDPSIDIVGQIVQIGKNYRQAIEQSGVKNVVQLSSVGSHRPDGNGTLRFHYEVEQLLGQLPPDVAIKVMRPPNFWVNLLRSMPTIKEQGALIANQDGDQKQPWVSPTDIAAAIADEIDLPFAGRSIRYVASDEVSYNEIAHVLGQAIGNPSLTYRAITDDQALQGMLASGMSRPVAEGFVSMQASQRSGLLYEDYYRHKPALGRVKLTDFAKEFAAVYARQ